METEMELPVRVSEKMSEFDGEEIKLVVVKPLCGSDVSNKHNRFCIPASQKIQNLLTPEEEKPLLEKDYSGRVSWLRVLFIEPSLKVCHNLRLKKWGFTMKMFSSSAPKVHANMTCCLKVDTQSPGWAKTLHKVLKKFDGLKYLIDAEEGTAIVTGRADPNKILKKLAKAGKHAEICCAGTDLQPYTNGYPYQHSGYSYPYSGYVRNGYYSNSYHQQGYHVPNQYSIPCLWTPQLFWLGIIKDDLS